MTLISKTAGGLSLISSIHDIHKTALIYSRNEYAKSSANATISNSVLYQKSDRLSYKDTQRKNWLSQSNFFASFKEGWGRVKGYVIGALKTSVRYIPNFICAGIALFASSTQDPGRANKIANAAALLLGGIEAWDFAKNTLGVGQRKDYLEM